VLFYSILKEGLILMKSSKSKKLAKIWIFLNGILILSAIIKKLRICFYFGLTYKRLGVFAFLILAIVEVYFFIKSPNNSYFLLNDLVFFGTILLCSLSTGNLIPITIFRKTKK
jgi:hypothetical protein